MRTSISRRLLILWLSSLVAVAVLSVTVTLLLTDRSGSNQTDPADFLEALAQREASALPPLLVDLYPQGLAELGSNDIAVFYAGLNEQGHICLQTTFIDHPNDVDVAGCMTPEMFPQLGVSSAYTWGGGAYEMLLLPDGYGRAIQEYDWGEAVGENVLFVADPGALPAGGVIIPPDDIGAPPFFARFLTARD